MHYLISGDDNEEYSFNLLTAQPHICVTSEAAARG